ncbi:MAG TPA: MBL fold metallo-hydrolase [Gemmatimonadales bacterium]|nr:MBL fold metallo-hydrolase [Gemmatimonadales bacterium]
MSYRSGLTVALALLLGAGALHGRQPAPPNRVTILYDAFGKIAGMKKDWGYSAFIEYNGKRILFDTGNNPTIFEQNVKAAGIDLRQLDYVVISHRHLDHTAGLAYLLRVNPSVKIYAPKEPFGVFGSKLPSRFYRSQDSLPEEMRYFDGHPSDSLAFGTAWPGGKFVTVDSAVEVSPGVHLISLVSDAPGTKELRELSLALQTPEGIVVVAGCSHPGIERIVAAAAGIDPHLHMVFGGFHLPAASDETIDGIATALHETYKVDQIAPGHCTGEPAFFRFRRVWKDRYVYAGVGTRIGLP